MRWDVAVIQIIISGLLGSIGGIASAFAEAPVIFTLEEARHLAVQHRSELTVNEARVEAAAAQMIVAQSGLRPRSQVSVELATAPDGQLVEVIDTTGNRVTVPGIPTLDSDREDGDSGLLPTYRLDALAGLEWQVIDFGRTAARKRAAQAERSVRLAETAVTRDELLDIVDEAYLGWLGATKQYELLEAAVRRAEQRMQEMKAQRDIGMAATSNILPLKYVMISAQLRASAGEHAVRRSRLSLESAVGGQRLPQTASPDMKLLELPPEARTAPAADYVHQLRARAAYAKADAAARALSPSFGLKAQVGMRLQEESFLPFYQGGLVFLWPIWDGGSHRGEQRRAQAEAEALRAQADVVKRHDAYRQKHLNVETEGNARRLELANALLKAADAIREDIESRMREGASTAQELEQADERVARAESEWLEARLERARLALASERKEHPSTR